jgi:hypothetical protein
MIQSRALSQLKVGTCRSSAWTNSLCSGRKKHASKSSRETLNLYLLLPPRARFHPRFCGTASEAPPTHRTDRQFCDVNQGQTPVRGRNSGVSKPVARSLHPLVSRAEWSISPVAIAVLMLLRQKRANRAGALQWARTCRSPGGMSIFSPRPWQWATQSLLAAAMDSSMPWLARLARRSGSSGPMGGYAPHLSLTAAARLLGRNIRLRAPTRQPGLSCPRDTAGNGALPRGGDWPATCLKEAHAGISLPSFLLPLVRQDWLHGWVAVPAEQGKAGRRVDR